MIEQFTRFVAHVNGAHGEQVAHAGRHADVVGHDDVVPPHSFVELAGRAEVCDVLRDEEQVAGRFPVQVSSGANGRPMRSSTIASMASSSSPTRSHT